MPAAGARAQRCADIRLRRARGIQGCTSSSESLTCGLLPHVSITGLSAGPKHNNSWIPSVSCMSSSLGLKVSACQRRVDLTYLPHWHSWSHYGE